MKKIGIIGAGISGLYLANLLEKNKNYDYKIFEKRTKFNIDDGYGIQLSVNSIKLSNMDMKIIFNKIDKLPNLTNKILLKKDNSKSKILPSFTKKIFSSIHKI